MEASTHEDADRWWVVADGGDVDEAYDRAVAAAADVWGSGHPLLHTVPDDMARPGPVRTRLGAQRAGRAADGTVAVAFAADRFFARRRVAVRVDDPGVELGVDGDVDGPVMLEIGDEAAWALMGTVGGSGGGELVDGVELRRLRCRYKVDVRRGEGPQQRVFVARVVDGEDRGQVIARGATATAVRREAAAVMRSAHDGDQRYAIEVYAEVRRASGPHLVLERHRVAQRGTLRVHLAAEKDPSRTKVAGWVFAGTVTGGDGA